ncbi:MAG: phenylalanine--tRNA ligase subunit beta [Candidatus Microgenomates bacterium]|jgi:phenylalanyl-tRNA synthetase beta chain
MDIKILNSWLRDYLETDATPSEIAKYLSLCGPSVERIENFGKDFIYDIEITTNRIDEAGVYGIAREASTILPRFDIKAKLKPIEKPIKEFNFAKKVDYLKATVNPILCPRFSAILIKNVNISSSPELIQKRLESAGIRVINNVVDISNYIMLELGQPVHTFDYDKIKGAEMILRESRKGEIIKTLDGKDFILPGGDIVIEDGKGRLIDLCGIMGGSLSAVDEYTKNVLLFVQTYDPAKIRKTSMSLAQRTLAATIFEKGTDTELVEPAILSAVKLFKELTGGKPEKDILNIYPNPYKIKTISTDLSFINQRLGIVIPKKDVNDYLESLGFNCKWSGDKLSVDIPSFRANDVDNAEGVLEEIARIYGYHNLPSIIIDGQIPTLPIDPKFAFEMRIKNVLAGFGGTEVYTLSLVKKEDVSEKALKLKNPLGKETEYLRTSLMPSLISAASNNLGTTDNFHIFEMANVYLPKIGDLPEEKLKLGGIFSEYSYRDAKGILEALIEKLKINANFESVDFKGFEAGKCAAIVSGKEIIGNVGYPENSKFIYYELDLEKLLKLSPRVTSFKEIPKYPTQIEDITLNLPERTRVGEIIQMIKQIKFVNNIELTIIYQNSYTFRIWYQDPKKTLTNEEVENIRKEIITSIKTKFGGTVKD